MCILFIILDLFDYPKKNMNLLNFINDLYNISNDW